MIQRGLPNPPRKGYYLKQDRIEVAKKLLHDFGWGYRFGIGHKFATLLVERAFDEHGRGELLDRPTALSESIQNWLHSIGDQALIDTWNELLKLPGYALILESGPGSIPTLSEWMRIVYWELLYRKELGLDLSGIEPFSHLPQQTD